MPTLRDWRSRRGDGVRGVGRRRFLTLACSSVIAWPSRFRAAWRDETIDGRRAGERRAFGGVRFCWCPPGRFVMGSPMTERNRRPDESQVDVALTRGFWMGQFEVTQGEWARVMGSLPARAPSAEFGLGDEVPVYWVSFLDAEGFCAALTARCRKTREIPDTWEYRVPTEAQWEYAARAGTTAATAYGESVSSEHANFASAESGDPAHGTPRRAVPVGRYPPNPWGLHDVYGNVFEWCRDYYHYQLPGGTNPDLRDVKGTRNRDGTYSRVRRGGAWNDDARWMRSAMRLKFEPERSSDHIGFRIALVRV